MFLSLTVIDREKLSLVYLIYKPGYTLFILVHSFLQFFIYHKYDINTNGVFFCILSFIILKTYPYLKCLKTMIVK